MLLKMLQMEVMLDAKVLVRDCVMELVIADVLDALAMEVVPQKEIRLHKEVSVQLKIKVIPLLLQALLVIYLAAENVLEDVQNHVLINVIMDVQVVAANVQAVAVSVGRAVKVDVEVAVKVVELLVLIIVLLNALPVVVSNVLPLV